MKRSNVRARINDQRGRDGGEFIDVEDLYCTSRERPSGCYKTTLPRAPRYGLPGPVQREHETKVSNFTFTGPSCFARSFLSPEVR